MNLNKFLDLLAESEIAFGHFSARTSYKHAELKEFFNEKGNNKSIPPLQITFEAATYERKTASLEISREDCVSGKFSYVELFPGIDTLTYFRLDFPLKNEFAHFHKFGKILKINFQFAYAATGIEYVCHVTAAIEN